MDVHELMQFFSFHPVFFFGQPFCSKIVTFIELYKLNFESNSCLVLFALWIFPRFSWQSDTELWKAWLCF